MSDLVTSEPVRRHYQGSFLVLASAVAAYALLSSLVTPVLATQQQDLHTSQANVTWVLTAYLLSASVFTPIIGRIGDKVGKERMLVVVLGALSVALEGMRSQELHHHRAALTAAELASITCSDRPSR